MDTLYPILKAAHVVSVVSWFAGLLYITRLFIYDVEAEGKEDVARDAIQGQLRIMARRLWFGITTPAMLATAVFGTWLMLRFGIYKMPWLHLKLLLVFGLFAYHFYLGRIRRNIVRGKNRLSALKLRFINEIGTLFLIGIVFIAYLKDFFDRVWGGVLLTGGTIFLLVLVFWLNRRRKIGV